MSKMFYKGRIDARENYENYGFANKKIGKAGTKKQPLNLTVTSLERQAELDAIVSEHEWFAVISVDEQAEENITELTALLDKPKTQKIEKQPNRNDPCICGSGKKYKKCCA